MWLKYGEIMGKHVKQALIMYCAPVLLGRKPSALFTLPSQECLSCLKESLDGSLSIKVLKTLENSILVMVYDYLLLESSVLKNESVYNAFIMFGYSENFSVSSYLDYLEKRFLESDGFPHEIGLFLGYPVDDVFGFILHKGEKYKHCGMWKVYGDEEYSLKCFKEYKYCEECMREHLSRGGTVKDFGIAYGMNISNIKEKN